MPRAVFGVEHLPVATTTPAPSQEPEPGEPATGRSRELEADTSEVNHLLSRWRRAVITGDINAQTILYAPRMDRYFRQRNVSRDLVRREKVRLKEMYPQITRYDISDVRIESSKDSEKVVSFRKDWDMRGERRFAGAERQRLKLRKISGDWKIVSEQDMKVYWSTRG
jgi:hypothetical protein